MAVTLNVVPPSKSLGPVAPPSGAQGILIQGSIENVTYYNPENGQCVISLKPFHLRSTVLINGFAPYLFEGMTVEAELKALSEAQKSLLLSDKITALEQSFVADRLKLTPPRSARTLRMFLKSAALSGVGDHLAKILSQTFPENLFEILEENPQALCKVKGIGKKKSEKIVEAFQEFKFKTEFEKFLFEKNLPLSWGAILWDHHGRDAKNLLLSDPYLIIDEFEFDFDLIDAFVLSEKLVFEPMKRVRAAIKSILRSHYKTGHCAHPEESVIQEALEKLNVERELIEEALEIELIEENLISDDVSGVPCFYLEKNWEIEQNVARQLRSFKKRPLPWGWFNLQKVLFWAQSILNIQLAPLQVEAIEKALSSSLTVITGGPGTGKTTLIRSLVAILKTQFASFVLCSPTGRGAQRLEEATGATALTIHRLLKYNSLQNEFTYNKDNPLPVDLVLIDEVSMVDIELMSHLLDALPPHAALILVGDVDQIPPVGAGHILQSLIQSEKFTTVKLTEIFRQSDQSFIKINAKRINEGRMPQNSEADFHYIPLEGADSIREKLKELITETIPNRYGITDPSEIQVLAPMNRGELGTQLLNRELQKIFSHHGGLKPKTITGFEQTLKVGDKVMVTKNDYRKDVFNGDIGFIQMIDHFEQIVDIQFDQRRVPYHFDELDRLTLAYAISIHKSQGSEYRAVIVVLAEEHLSVAQRQLIYTAVTRGKEHVFLVAEPKALETAITSQEDSIRWRKLAELLAA